MESDSEDEVVDPMLFLEELYVARCKDTTEQPTREEFLRFSSRLKKKTSGPFCILRSQHLGVSAANTLSKFCRNRRDLIKLDLFCNVFRDHGLSVITHFVQLNKNLKIFNIGCNDLTDKSAQQIHNLIVSNHLNSLQLGATEKALHPNTLTNITMSYIAEALSKSQSLQSLGLDATPMGYKSGSQHPPAEASLAKIFSHSTSLLHLDMCDCNLDSSRMIDAINDGLVFNSTIQRINFSKNNMSSAFGVRFADYLLQTTKHMTKFADPKVQGSVDEWEESEKRPNVFYVDLSENDFQPEVAIKFSLVLNSYPKLGYLNLSGNNVGDDGVKSIALALETNQTLVELHLADCKITSVGGIALCESLLKNEVLNTLNISNNKLGDLTADAISDLLKNNRSISSLGVATAMLSSNGGSVIAEATIKCPNLTSLDMANNFFTEETGSEFEKIFKQNTHILKINVSGTQINHFSFHALNNICSRNASFLKKVAKQPIRDKYLRSQYIKGELDRKTIILKNLTNENSDLQEKINDLESIIRTTQDDEYATASSLQKQIIEKEQTLENEQSAYEEKMVGLNSKREELLQMKEHLEKEIETHKKATESKKKESAEKRAFLAELSKDITEKTAKMNAEVDALEKATMEIVRLAENPEELALLKELPQFLSFDVKEEKKRTRVRKETVAQNTDADNANKTPERKIKVKTKKPTPKK